MRIQERAASIAWQGIRLAVSASALDPERQKTASLYLLVTGCNIPGALAATVAGCTKQNVSKALQAVESRRDAPAFDAALSRLEIQLFGEL